MGVFLFFLSQGIFAGAGDPTEAVSRGYVTPKWLKSHADDSGLIIVDVSFEKEHYEKEHIPGAVFVDWRHDLADPNDKKYYRIVPKDGFEGAMSRIGATTETMLVFYDNRQNRMAIRALWVAAYYAHQKTAILEGGILAWVAAGNETTTEIPEVNPTIYRAKDVHPEMNVEKSYVEQNLRNPEILFVDSRPWKMYTGQAPGRLIHTGEKVARRGHLPGAVNLPWKDHIDASSRFLDHGSLKKIYDEKGVESNILVIFYCNEGLHAVFNWFAATKLLGFEKVKVYEGSMGEWADDPLLPMVSGIGF